MALGAAPGSDVAALTELHRRALAEPGRVILVAKVDGEVVGMAHLVPSGAANAPHERNFGSNRPGSEPTAAGTPSSDHYVTTRAGRRRGGE